MRTPALLTLALTWGLVLAGCGRSPLLAQAKAPGQVQGQAIGCIPGQCGGGSGHWPKPTPKPCGPRAQGATDAILPPGLGGGGSYPGGGCGCVGPRAQGSTDAYLPPSQGGATPNPPCR